MSTFVEVSSDRLVSMIRECGAAVEARGGTFQETRAGRERVFDLAGPNRAVIRVYSSIAVGQDTARDVGKDAIRIIVGATLPEGWRNVLPPRRIFRTAPRQAADREGVFLERLRGALREAWVQAREVPRCARCGSLMAQRKRRDGSGAFWGCLGYPRCSGTRPC